MPAPTEFRVVALACEAVFDRECSKGDSAGAPGKFYFDKPAVLPGSGTLRAAGTLSRDQRMDSTSAGPTLASKHVDPGVVAFRLRLPGLLASDPGVAQALDAWFVAGPAEKGRLAFCAAAVGAFFDNDLLQATRYFLKRATGSFGLCVSCSLDAHRQV
jgi:hypothetical protein